MIQRKVNFERSAHSADAIQRAIYKFSDRLSCDLTIGDQAHLCALHLQNADAKDIDETISDFRNEVLDQTLRERIRGETERSGI